MKSIIFDYLLIKRSKCFDSRYYLRQNRDVRLSDIDPLMHFIKMGWKEGRNPSANFDTHQYLEAHPELNGKNINPLIHSIQQKRHETLAQRASFKSRLQFVLKGAILFLKLRGIVFFAGYPYPEREKDGYYQRIRSIDNLFLDRWRVYIDPVNLPGRDAWYDFPAPKTLVIRPHTEGYKKIARFYSMLCIIRCGVTYFHSILSSGGIEKSRLFWRYPFITRILDMHGAVPEEFGYQGDPQNAQYFADVEKQMVGSVDYLIVVTEAMRRHVDEKYPGMFKGRYITLPIFQEMKVIRSDKPAAGAKPVVVYAGGLQKWQQVPKMVAAMISTADRISYRFFCPQPEEVITLLPKRMRRNPSIIVESRNSSELVNEYHESHYGFALREDILVNHVACPTKLIEYLAAGIVPILDCEKIGDFTSMGMQYIPLNDLLSLNLPEEPMRKEMAIKNYDVYEQLLKKHQTGVENLIKAVRRFK